MVQRLVISFIVDPSEFALPRNTPSLPLARHVASAERPHADLADEMQASAAAENTKLVVIVQRRLTHYRIPLFDSMRAMLADVGVELRLVHGDSMREEFSRKDTGTLPWATKIVCHYWFRGRVCWQNLSAHVRDADLVVMPQENKMLFNYWFMLTRGRRKLAFWGHGRNFQTSRADSLRERIKRKTTRSADWWFAYTDISKDVMVRAGITASRITVLHNSIDMHELTAHHAQADRASVAEAAQRMNIPNLEGKPVAISVASLHAEKLVPFLIDAAFAIRERLPDFQLIVVGDGAERGLVQSASERSGGWIHWVGARKGLEKVQLIKMATLMLNPGMVGLNILDALACGTPLITTDCKLHSPEIAYLRPNQNGIMTKADIRSYTDAVVDLYLDPRRIERLAAGCRESSQEYSLERMATNFCSGIAQALAA